MAELEAEFEKSRAEIASYLRDFANKLDTASPASTEKPVRENPETSPPMESNNETDRHSSTGESHKGEKVTILAGNDSATINPPKTVTFSVAVDSDSSLMESGAEESVTFNLRWATEEIEADNDLGVH
ncbi:amphi-Trp domain-containing protein [Haladaptatus halobius]|uniref:amphi-Trp domain-containing protein n=1 Tax=Haladaptatus halobius TaxID=2884875 RepID=UPI001D09D4C0|nr:amphi-Trp domain-containing protein [Haladaptatus halobius]